jgi:hypothetical protein
MAAPLKKMEVWGGNGFIAVISSACPRGSGVKRRYA